MDASPKTEGSERSQKDLQLCGSLAGAIFETSVLPRRDDHFGSAASDPIGNGRHIVYYYNFHVKVGETAYVGRYSSRKNNVIKKGEWPVGSNLSVRFEKKSAVIAHATYMFVKKLDKNDEIRTIVDEGLGRGKQAKESELTE